MSNVTRVVKASEHSDADVREAENFGIALKAMIEDMSSGRISAEIFGHSYQKFCVDQIKRIRKEGVAAKDATIAELQAENARLNSEYNHLYKNAADLEITLDDAKIENAQLKGKLAVMTGLARDVYDSEMRWVRKGVQTKSDWAEEFEASISEGGEREG